MNSMTPEEKANSLISKFFNYVDDVKDHERLQVKCAIIAVEEIISALENYDKITERDWNSVFSELKQRI